MIHIVKGFSVVNEAEVDIFLEFPCIFYDPMYVGNLISGISKLTFKILLFFILYWNIVDLWASLVAQLVKNLPARQEALVLFLSLKDHLEKRWATHSSIHGLPWHFQIVESACNVGDLCLISGLGRSPKEGMARHSSVFAWRIPMNREAWKATVHRVAKSWT